MDGWMEVVERENKINLIPVDGYEYRTQATINDRAYIS